MGFPTFATVERGEVRTAVPGFADGTRVHVIVAEKTAHPKLAREMADAEYDVWHHEVIGDGFLVEEPSDPPAEPVVWH